MLKLLMIFGLVLCCGVVSQAQSTFVLIDDSGSMDTSQKQMAAQAYLERELLTFEEKELVSINYYGGENGGSCGGTVQIDNPRPFNELTIRDRTPRPSGFTPFVSALEEILELSADEQTEIIAIGDAEDTCGRSICSTVPGLMRNHPNASLRFYFTDASNERIDAIGCVVNAAHSELDLIPGIRANPPAGGLDERAINWDELELLERSYLFIVVSFALAWAILFIFIFSHKATEAEKKTQNLSRQEAGEAEDNDPEEESDDLELVDASTPRRAALAWVSAILSGGLLFGLLVIDEAHSPDWLNFADARAAAWYIANSAFATAFAILAISPVLFAAGQYWRHNQARHTYFVVSGEYAAEQRRIKGEKRRQHYQDYIRLRDEVGEITFSMPRFKSHVLTRMAMRRSSVRQAKFLSAQGVEQQKWIEVCNTVRILAKGAEAPFDKHSIVKKEVKRLTRYVELKGPLKSLPEFIDTMIEDQEKDFDPKYWKQLAEGVRKTSPIAINSSLRELTEK